MDMLYKIIYDKNFYEDLGVIENKTTKNYYRNLKDKINIIIENLQFMPKMHKTLYYKKDTLGEYRRIIIKKHSIIYKIKDNQIIILRIFNQRENYLNSEKFILKEKTQKYYRKENGILK